MFTLLTGGDSTMVVGKTLFKVGLNLVSPGAGLCVTALEIGYDLYNGDNAGAAVNILCLGSGIASARALKHAKTCTKLVQVASGDIAKEPLKEASMEAVKTILNEAGRGAKEEGMKEIIRELSDQAGIDLVTTGMACVQGAGEGADEAIIEMVLRQIGKK